MDETAFFALAEKAAKENSVADQGNAEQKLAACRRRMSDMGGAIRKKEAMESALQQVRQELSQEIGGDPLTAYRYRDALICQQVLLESMLDYQQVVGDTRGSALYYCPSGQKREGLEEMFRFVSQPKACAQQVQEGVLTENGCRFTWRPVRPLPEGEDFFENVWRGYRENKNVY